MLRGGYGMVYYPGSGGIGSAPSDLGGGGFLTTTGVNLGQLPSNLLGAPNTPPPGSSLTSPFTAGYFEPPATQVGGSVTTAFRDLETPYAHMWNVSLQRELPWQMVGEVAYVGTRHRHLWTNLARDTVPAEYLSQGVALNQPVPNPFFGIIRSGDAALTGRTTNAAQLLRPFPHYTGIARFRDSVGDAWYNGFTLRLEKRAEKGLTYQLAYTLSREEDTVPERFGARASNGIVDPRDLGRSRAVVDDDRTHVLTANFIWELPLGPGHRWASSGWIAHVIGGWRLSGVGIFATGHPLVLLMPAVMLYVGARGRTFKEAQSNSSIVIFVVSIVPVVQLFMQSREPPWLAYLPIASQYALLSRVLRGEALSVISLASSYALPLVLTVIALLAVARLVSREAVFAGR